MRHISPMLLTAIPLLAASLPAQRLWLPPNNTRYIGFDIGNGFYKATPQASVDFASFNLTVQSRFPLNDKLAVTAAIPFARISETSSFITGAPGQSISQTAFGDPWLGVEAVAKPGLVIEAGLRPGIASKDKSEALSLGVINDFDRMPRSGCS